MTLQEHIQSLRDLARKDFEDNLAEIQRYADEAAALGDVERRQRWLDHLESLKSLPLPWEQPMPV